MFRIPPITKNLLVINVLMYLATVILERNGIMLTDMLGLHFFKAESFMPYQLVTYMFMHANFNHIFFNMLAFWMFGRILEQVWGPRRYLIFYLVCGVGAGICQEVVQYFQYVSEGLANFTEVTNGVTRMPMSEYLDLWTTVGASGAVYGILLGFGMSFPNERILLLIPPIPLKAKYLVMGYVAIELFMALEMKDTGVAHFAHIGGMLFGFLLILYWRHKARSYNSGFSGWTEYKPKGESFWNKLKAKMKPKATTAHRRTESSTGSSGKTSNYTSSHTSDTSGSADSLERRRQQQEEIDRILDKVKKSGYSCLTEQEKKAIFDFRNRR